MGFFSDINQAFGGPDAGLLQTGTLAFGRVLRVTPSGGTVQVGGGLIERNCDFQILVLVDRQIPYQVVIRQRVQEIYLPQLQSGIAGVAVRVDPANPQHVTIDFATPPPNVRVAQTSGPGTASSILENGRDATAVIVGSTPLGYSNYLGDGMQEFTLTVIDGATPPYQTKAASAVPAESLPLVFPGSKVHVKIGDQPGAVVIDFTKGAAK